MSRRELNSEDIKIEQKPSILDPANYDGDVILADKPLNTDYADALAFGEEPVTIRIEPSADKNAATAFPAWVNGKGAEVLQNGHWLEVTYLPAGRELTTKRKYLAVLASSKLDTVHTKVSEPESENPNNVIDRFTSATCSFSVIEDKNPKGAAWLTDLRRRNF